MNVVIFLSYVTNKLRSASNCALIDVTRTCGVLNLRWACFCQFHSANFLSSISKIGHRIWNWEVITCQYFCLFLVFHINLGDSYDYQLCLYDENSESFYDVLSKHYLFSDYLICQLPRRKSQEKHFTISLLCKKKKKTAEHKSCLFSCNCTGLSS